MHTLKDLEAMIRGGMSLDDGVLVQLRDGKDGMSRAVRFVFVLGLLVGLLPAAVGLARDIRRTPANDVAEVRLGMEEAVRQLAGLGLFGDDPGALDKVLENARANFALGESVARTATETTPAPYPVVRAIESLAGWLSTPFGWLSTWLAWGVVSLLFARMLRGTATIAQLLATTSLAFAPHVMDAFSFVPCGGALLQVLALVWGLAVYVKATAVANRFGLGSAAAAVFAPALVVVLLAFGGLAALVLLLSAAG